MTRPFYLILSLFFLSALPPLQSSKTYVERYSESGQLQAIGWQIGAEKTDYWIYYHPNGAIAKKGAYRNNIPHGYWFYFKENGAPIKEGHYRHGKAEHWWVIYNDTKGQTEKYQYKNDQKEGYCFYYRNKKLFKAEKYEADQKIEEWTNLASFIQDNPKTLF